MSGEKLESFKIGDKQKPRVKSTTAVKAVEKAPEAYSLGFARIEGILDNEAPGEVLQSLTTIIASLDEKETEAKTPKAKAPYKKARAAVQRTLELLEYLFSTKDAMAVAALEKDQEPKE